MLVKLPETDALTTQEILDRLGKQSVYLDESNVLQGIEAQLEMWGMKNRRKGYYIPLRDRPAAQGK